MGVFVYLGLFLIWDDVDCFFVGEICGQGVYAIEILLIVDDGLGGFIFHHFRMHIIIRDIIFFNSFYLIDLSLFQFSIKLTQFLINIFNLVNKNIFLFFTNFSTLHTQLLLFLQFLTNILFQFLNFIYLFINLFNFQSPRTQLCRGRANRPFNLKIIILFILFQMVRIRESTTIVDRFP